jgi:hypothetical protein
MAQFGSAGGFCFGLESAARRASVGVGDINGLPHPEST